MSLIFKALKKLKAQPSQKPEGNEDLLRKSANVYSFQKIIFSPLVIIMLFITGLFVYYGFQFLISYLHQNPQASVSSPSSSFQSHTVEPSHQGNETGIAKEKLEIPTHPENMPETKKQDMQQQQPGVSYPETDPTTSIEKDHQIEYMEKDRDSSITSSQITDAGDQEKPQPENQPAALLQNLKNGFPVAVNQKQPVQWEEKPGNEPSGNSLLAISTEQNRKQSMEEILVQTKIEKGRKVASLISNIEESIQKQDYQETEQLIQKLSDLTQKDNPYLLKIKSFFYIKTRKYQQAVEILQRVLAKDQNDLEANINMAIIEIKNGKIEDAHLRLVNMAKIYPENSTIQDLIHNFY
jgi:hypothetical protein